MEQRSFPGAGSNMQGSMECPHPWGHGAYPPVPPLPLVPSYPQLQPPCPYGAYQAVSPEYYDYYGGPRYSMFSHNQWRGVLCDISIVMPFKPMEND